MQGVGGGLVLVNSWSPEWSSIPLPVHSIESLSDGTFADSPLHHKSAVDAGIPACILCWSLVFAVKHLTSKCSVNPRIEEIKKILKKFNSSWKNAFGEEVKKLPPRCSESLKSLVEDRNHVAHGGTIGSSFSDIVGYYCQARRVVSKLEDILPVVNPQE